MIRGTTPTHIFNIPLDASLIKDVKITYVQGGEIVLERRAKDCEINGSTVTVQLTQEETFKFNCNKKVYFQVRVLTTGGEVVASRVISADVDMCLDNEVLG